MQLRYSDSLARQVVEGIHQLSLPPDFKHQLSPQDKASLFFYLSSVELHQKKIVKEEEIPKEELPLKKVRIIEKYENGTDTFYSFKCELNLKPPEAPVNTNISVQHSSESIEQAVELWLIFRSHERKDELGPKDNSIILSLNQMVQSGGVGWSQLIRVTKLMLTSEARAQMYTRYDELCKSLREIISTCARMDGKRQNQSQIVANSKELVELFLGLPRYNNSLLELLKTLCELNYSNQGAFETYFNCFKEILQFTHYSITTMSVFIKINHSGMLDHLKEQKDKFNQQHQQIIEEEALNKVDQLSTAQNWESCLRYIFYVQLQQIRQSSSQTQLILSKLVESYPQLPENVQTAAFAQLKKIKETMEQDPNQTALKDLIKSISKQVRNWNQQSLQMIQLFVEGCISTKELPSRDLKIASELFVSFLDKAKGSDNLINLTFGGQSPEYSKIVPHLLSGVSLTTYAQLVQQDKAFKSALMINKDAGVQLFLRFVQENQNALKPLMKFFFEIIDTPERVKHVLREINSTGKPQAICMVIVLEKAQNSNELFEDEIIQLLKLNWRENKNLSLGLKAYLQKYPKAKDRIYVSIDNITKQQLEQL